MMLPKVDQTEEATERERHMFELVGLEQSMLNNYPHQFSVGQRQRGGRGRAMALKPELVIADEAVSALDVSVQAQVMNLMLELQQEMGLSYLFISHDLAVVERIAHRVAVMYLGRIVERAAVRPLLKTPRHPYTRGLLYSLPSLTTLSGRLPSIPGNVPSPFEVPPGCPFHPRCQYFQAGRCDVGEPPELRDLDEAGVDTRKVACHRAEEI